MNIAARIGRDPSYKRLQYVRYADDFLIGVIGSREDCITIREDVAKFLSSLGLELSLQKTKITHAARDKASFLGAHIRGTPIDKRASRLVTRGGKTYSVRIAGKLQLLAPIRELKDKLLRKGLCGKSYNPRSWSRMINVDDARMVVHFLSL